MIYKLIMLIIEELIAIGMKPEVSDQFRQDLAEAVKSLRKIKKYF